MNHDSISDRIFTNEDLERPENRINVAMFGVMAQDWFRVWLLSELDLCDSAVVYPPTNVGLERPDFTVEDPETRDTLGWIEVEIGSDAGQQKRYADRFSEPVKTIWGADSSDCDLSLERISERLKEELETNSRAPQAQLSVVLLRKLIETALSNATSASKPVTVSDAMKSHWLVRALSDCLGERLDFELRPAVPGYVKANARAEHGLSLRVYSRIASQKEVSVLHIRGGVPNNPNTEDIRFARRARLKKYLPDSGEAIGAWSDLVRRLGGELDVRKPDHVPVRLDRQAFTERKTEFAECLVALGRSPSTQNALGNLSFDDFFGEEAAGQFREALVEMDISFGETGAEINLTNPDLDASLLARAFEILIRDGNRVARSKKTDQFEGKQRFTVSTHGEFHAALFGLARRFDNVWVEGKRDYAIRVAHERHESGVSLVRSKGTDVLETGRPRRARKP